MTCGACGAALANAAKFCFECGQPQQLGCASCGAPLPVAAKFCGECGSSTGVAGPPGAAIPVPRATPTAERRVCSVLFCDLVGFTPMSEARDPEEVRELLSR